MRNIIIATVLFFMPVSMAQSQQVTLGELIKAALDNHPLTGKLDSEQAMHQVKSDGIRTTFWPDISLNAQLGYQSMVPELPFQMPGTSRPDIPKDRYQASIDVSQLIYDGGITQKRLKLQEIETRMSQARIMVDRYPVQQQVVDAWFGLELLSVQRSILRLTLEDLEARLKLLRVGHEEGVVMLMDVDRVSVELQRIRQKDDQIHADSTRMVDILSEITGVKFGVGTEFVHTEELLDADGPARIRPEVELFDLASDLADIKVDIERAARRPKVNSYVQGAYGKPGLDIFADSFSPFWQAGVRASWPLWDKGGTRRDREANHLVKSQIDHDRALFDRSIRLAIEQQETEIEKNRELIASDEEIIVLQERIKMASEAKLDEGIINATDYLYDVRAVEQARIQYESRKIAIRYAQALINIIRGGI